jgi:hypothetical protein
VWIVRGGEGVFIGMFGVLLGLKFLPQCLGALTSLRRSAGLGRLVAVRPFLIVLAGLYVIIENAFYAQRDLCTKRTVSGEEGSAILWLFVSVPVHSVATRRPACPEQQSVEGEWSPSRVPGRQAGFVYICKKSTPPAPTRSRSPRRAPLLQV